MRNYVFGLAYVVSASISSFAVAQQMPTSSEAPSASVIRNYKIDHAHSKISFTVAHLVVSSVTGEFKKFEGGFKFNPADFSATSIQATADSASVYTGSEKRDEHLRSPDFFDVKKYPTFTFASTKATKIDGKHNEFDILGDLTLRGVTKPVVFHTTYKGGIKLGDGIVQAFKASTKINRKDFGIKFNTLIEGTPAVGDEVEITINIEGKSEIAKLSQAKK